MVKKIVLIFAFILLMGVSIYFLLPNKVAVLGYHGVISENNESNDMRIYVKKFEKQMKYLKKMNFKSLTLDEMECYMNNKCKIGKNTVLITFDDGYKNNYELAFPILKKYGFNAVVFLIGNRIENDEGIFFNKEYIEKTKKEYPNIEFASHSYDMHNNHEALNMSYEDYVNDFKKQKKLIDTKYYAYPYGEYNDDMIKVLKENDYNLAFGFGYDGDFKKASNKDNKYVIPRLSINSSMPLWKFKLRMLLPY